MMTSTQIKNFLFELRFSVVFPSLKHLVFLKYPTTGKAADGFMTLNGFDFPKNMGDGTE